MSLYVKFWGTRGSIPTPGYRTQRYGGNTACVEVRHEQTVIICDAGSGIRELGLSLNGVKTALDVEKGMDLLRSELNGRSR